MEPRRLYRPPALAVDTALALLLSGFLVLAEMERARHGGPGTVGTGVWLVVGAGASLALRRRLPPAAYAGSVGFTAAYLFAGNPPGPIFLAPFLALLGLIAASPIRIAAPAALGGAALLALAHGSQSGWSLGVGIFGAAWLLLAALFAAGLQVRRRIRAEVAARAAWAERSRQDQARRRMAEERLGIAREVHDVVGHSLAVISLQAGVAERLLQSRPEQVREAVAAIRQVSRQALDDLRAELALLRGESLPAEARLPLPGLDSLPHLVDSVRQAGLRVALHVDAAAAGAPDIVAAAAYRIVQESLTNVARHAGAGARAEVHVLAEAGGLRVAVTDDGPGMAGSGGEGSGLAGMRERAAALGGSFWAGNRPGGGFAVTAALPWRRR